MKNARGKRAGLLLFGAASLAFAFYLTARFFVTTQTGQLIDQRAFNGAHLGQRSVAPVTLGLLDAIPITGVAIALIIAVLVAVSRKNGWVLLAGLAAAVAANVVTQLVKHVLLDRPDLDVSGYAYNSLPSGHTALAASSVLVVFLVSGQRFRPLVAAVGAFFTASVGISTLANQWHRPSDVIAALLLVAFFGCLAGLLMNQSRFTADAPSRDVLSRWLLVLALFGLAVVVVSLLASAFEPFAYIGAAAAVATCALFLAASGARAFRYFR